jgi:hypothetical protein
MTSSGSPHTHFRRTLATENRTLVRATAAEQPHVDLAAARDVCALIAEHSGRATSERRCVGLGRFAHEQAADLIAVAEAADALGLLRIDPTAGAGGTTAAAPVRSALTPVMCAPEARRPG